MTFPQDHICYGMPFSTDSSVRYVRLKTTAVIHLAAIRQDKCKKRINIPFFMADSVVYANSFLRVVN